MSNLPENIPENLFVLLGEMADDFPTLLANNLVGIYLWGSLTYDGFDERCSDADLIVVTRRNINKREFSALEDWFAKQLKKNSWAEKLDMRFVIDGEFLDKTSRCCGYHFGKLTRHGSDANPIIWVNIAESGITLLGKPAKEIAPFDNLLRTDRCGLIVHHDGSNSDWFHRRGCQRRQGDAPEQ